MSLFRPITGFLLTVVDGEGKVIPGAMVVIRNAANVDVTALVIGQSPASTGVDGRLVKIGSPPPVPAGVHTVTVTKTGYATNSFSTDSGFKGAGIFSLVLSRAIPTPTFTVTGPALFVSTYAPIPLTVNFSGSPKPDILELTITHIDGRSSVMRLPVNKQTGIVTAYLQSRIRLEPAPVFVPTTALVAVDPYFSDRITVNMAVYYGADRVVLTPPVVFMAANLYPPTTGNDLTAWATGDAAGFVRWVCPATVPVVTPGYYYDAILWLLPLTDAPAGSNYLLKRNYYMADGTTLVIAQSNPVVPNLQAQRIAINRLGLTIIKRATFFVTNDLGTRISHFLNIVFNG